MEVEWRGIVEIRCAALWQISLEGLTFNAVVIWEARRAERGSLGVYR
jgi:hypothetical protein